MKHAILLITLLAAACQGETIYLHDADRAVTLTACSDTDVSSSSGDESSSSAEGENSSDEGSSSESGAEPNPIAIPTPTATCPTIVNGDVQFCPAGLAACRTARVVNANNADGSGPLSLHWHGTYENPVDLLAWDWAAGQIRNMVVANDGLMILPWADPDAVYRANNPFPWFAVCGQEQPSLCDRQDDFLLANEIVACAVEQELVDPARLTTSGMSAGGIMTSYLLDRVGYFAGAVVWSGGLPFGATATPEGDTAVMVLHGGHDGTNDDIYCGDGTTSCYYFTEPSVALAEDVVGAGNYAFLCDHQSGHSASMGGEGAEFIRRSYDPVLGDGLNQNSWIGYPFPSGGNWMLNNYCYDVGGTNPQG
jgi:predicted esterase